MKSPEKVLKRLLHPFVFAIWAGFLTYVLVSRRYMAFLRPEFGILLVLAQFIAIGFMLAAIIRPKTTEIDVSAILRTLVLLVPVLYFVAMPDTMLGDQAFKKRFVGTNNGATHRQAPPKYSSEVSAKNTDSSATLGKKTDTRQETPKERTLLDIFRNPDSFKGQRVVVTGMFLHDEQLKPHFGGKEIAVYRFLINCCAADAVPLAIALDFDQTDAFAKNQWVQVDGIFDLHQIDGSPVPIISTPQIKPVEEPAVPYLF